MNGRRSPLLERPVIREQFRKELRGRLMSEAVVVLAKRPSRFTLPMILRPALATAAALVLVVAGATSAAASSLPGDALYGVKRAAEDVRLALTFDVETRTHLLAELTDERLEELAEIAKRRPSSAPTATQENSVSEDKRLAAQALAEAARAKHKAVLDAVKDRLSEDDQTDVQKVIDREEERTSNDPGRGQGGRPTNPPGRPTPRK